MTLKEHYNASSNHSPKGYTYSDRSQIGTDGTVTSSTVADGYTKGHSQWQGGDVEASYEIDTLQLLTLSLPGEGVLYALVFSVGAVGIELQFLYYVRRRIVDYLIVLGVVLNPLWIGAYLV